MLATEQRIRNRAEIYGSRLHRVYSLAVGTQYFLYWPDGRLAKHSFCLSAIDAFLDEQLVSAVQGLSPGFKEAFGVAAEATTTYK